MEGILSQDGPDVAMDAAEYLPGVDAAAIMPPTTASPLAAITCRDLASRPAWRPGRPA
jgi:hypothetical protein